MALSGSGTQADPYIFNSFVELLEEQLDPDYLATDYYRYGGSAVEEDFNDIAPQGITETMEIRGNIDFNNLTLSNIRAVINKVISITGTIKNVKFKNVVWTTMWGSAYFIYRTSSSDTQEYSNISISMEIEDTQTTTDQLCIFSSGASAKSLCNQWAITLKGALVRDSTTNGFAIFTGIFNAKDININFDDLVMIGSNQIMSIGYMNTTASGIHLLGCYIGGKVTCNELNDVNGSDRKAVLNIFNVETSGLIKHTGSGKTIFNSTKAPNVVTDTSHSFIGVTDQQMQDASYLQSIGFPCYDGG